MQKYVGDIIFDVRRDTLNADDVPAAGSVVGIETKDFLRYVNYGQQKLQSHIAKISHEVFEQTTEISVVVGQAAYSISDNVFLGTRIRSVRYSRSGNAVDYRRLLPKTPYDTYSNTGWPTRYHRRNGQIILEPTPDASGGKLEVVYERTLDGLDLRRAKVNATPSGTSVVLNFTGTEPESETEPLLTANSYVCICDAFGSPRLYNAVISSYDSGTNTITTAANVSTYLITGYALSDLNGGFVTLGKYTRTHSELPDDCERYLSSYAAKKLFKREASDTEGSEAEDLNDILKDILASFKMPDKDVKPIPILDYTMFDLSYGHDD